MPSYSKKISLFLLAVFILTAIFFSGIIDKKETYFAQASFWNTIRAWITINPLSVDVSAPGEVKINKVFKVTAKIINKGEEKIENARGEIFLPVDKLVLLRKNPVQKIGVIPGKKEKKISWAVKGEEKGTHVITVSASGELKGQLVKAEDSTMVKVKLSLQGKNLWQWLQELLRFLKFS